MPVMECSKDWGLLVLVHNGLLVLKDFNQIGRDLVGEDIFNRHLMNGFAGRETLAGPCQRE